MGKLTSEETVREHNRGKKAVGEGRSRYWSEPWAYPFESDEHYELRRQAFEQCYTAQHRHKCGEDLTSNAASNCARDGVARRAEEAHVLQRRARCIATECTGYNLNYEIDECC